MNTDPVPSPDQQINWVPMPDPVTEGEVNIDLKWTADSRTQLAIQRQTKLLFASTVRTWSVNYLEGPTSHNNFAANRTALQTADSAAESEQCVTCARLTSY